MLSVASKLGGLLVVLLSFGGEFQKFANRHAISARLKIILGGVASRRHLVQQLVIEVQWNNRRRKKDELKVMRK